MFCIHNKFQSAFFEATPEQRAQAYVWRLRAFYHHLAFFLMIGAALVTINLLNTPQYLWVKWPLLGWGIGLALHGLTLHRRRWLGRDWEARKMREYLESESSK